MKSNDRIIKDIRFFESECKNFEGNFDGIIGNVYKNTEDTNSIGQRIARKLNEYEFISGEYDHIYINLTEKIELGQILENNKTLDKRIKNIDFGIEAKKFNSSKEYDKNLLIKELTFKALKNLYKNDDYKIKKIIEVENLLNKFETEIEIAYKIKETKSYKIEIRYMIKPNNGLSKIVIRFSDKKDGIEKIITRELFHYEDIFYLVGKIDFKSNKIILSPKKSYIGQIATANYKTPIEIKINEMEKL